MASDSNITKQKYPKKYQYLYTMDLELSKNNNIIIIIKKVSGNTYTLCRYFVYIWILIKLSYYIQVHIHSITTKWCSHKIHTVKSISQKKREKNEYCDKETLNVNSNTTKKKAHRKKFYNHHSLRHSLALFVHFIHTSCIRYNLHIISFQKICIKSIGHNSSYHC